MKRSRLFALLLSFVLVMGSASVDVVLARAHHGNGIGHEKEAERAQEAAKAMTEIMGIEEQGIPEGLMSRARGIAVIPGVKKGAFGVGGRYGKGLMSQRMSNGKWSAPTYVDISGGSFGLQIGVESNDLVLVFTNEEGVNSILDGKLKLGADASVAAGPVGRKAEVGTDVKFDSAILSYSRSKGLFAGVSLDGSVISIDDSANHEVYGSNVTAQSLLAGKVQTNRITQPFVAALERYAPMTKRISQK